MKFYYFINLVNRRVKKEGKFVSSKGFSLVELLVAIAIFVVVLTFSMGSLLSVLDAGRKARSLKSVMTNLNFTLEIMSREIKFGNSYRCGIASSFPPAPLNCTGQSTPGTAISFVSSEGQNIIYRINSTGNGIEKSTNGGTSYLAVTAPEVTVQDLRFYVFNSQPESGPSPDGAQPRVVMVVRGYAGEKPSLQSNFILQTTVSQRSLDI
jgi:prepilin-type N-terminal cleavage/methylation domain-containing protein